MKNDFTLRSAQGVELPEIKFSSWEEMKRRGSDRENNVISALRAALIDPSIEKDPTAGHISKNQTLVGQILKFLDDVAFTDHPVNESFKGMTVVELFEILVTYRSAREQYERHLTDLEKARCETLRRVGIVR